MTRRTVVIADDHQMLREGVVNFLESVENIEVIGQAADGLEAVSETKRLQPDLLVIDLQLPKLHGLMAIKEVLRMASPPAVIVMSMHSQPYFLAQAISAGALAYVLKEGAVQELVTAIDEVMAGRPYMSPRLENGARSSIPGASLSEREQEVLRLIAAGQSTRSIAEALHVSPKTIESHRRNIMDKLDLHSVAELTQHAIRMGLIEH